MVELYLNKVNTKDYWCDLSIDETSDVRRFSFLAFNVGVTSRGWELKTGKDSWVNVLGVLLSQAITRFVLCLSEYKLPSNLPFQTTCSGTILSSVGWASGNVTLPW